MTYGYVIRGRFDCFGISWLNGIVALIAIPKSKMGFWFLWTFKIILSLSFPRICETRDNKGEIIVKVSILFTEINYGSKVHWFVIVAGKMSPKTRWTKKNNAIPKDEGDTNTYRLGEAIKVVTWGFWTQTVEKI